MKEEYIVRTEKAHGCTVKTFYDVDYCSCIDADEEYNGDDGVFLVNYHRDFDVRRDDIITEDAVRDWYHDKPIAQSKEYHIWELSCYVHSGVALHLGRGYFEKRCDAGGWDTSYVGLVLVSKKEFRSVEKAKKAALAHVETWNHLLSGSVYGYVVEDSGGQLVDSCGGFLGDEEYCMKEGIDAAQRYEREQLAKHAKKLRGYVRNHVPLDKRKVFQV